MIEEDLQASKHLYIRGFSVKTSGGEKNKTKKSNNKYSKEHNGSSVTNTFG